MTERISMTDIVGAYKAVRINGRLREIREGPLRELAQAIVEQTESPHVSVSIEVTTLVNNEIGVARHTMTVEEPPQHDRVLVT